MKDWEHLPGRLFVVSGPSGSGKSTIARRVLSAIPAEKLVLSTSATTRPPRPGEEHGREYFFLDRDEFESRRGAGRFLESAEVYGRLYGTPAEPVRDALASGRDVILEIDVQGAEQVRDRVASAFRVFIDVPSLEELGRRLRGRGGDSEESIARRLASARVEIEAGARYDHRIVNDELDRAVEELARVIARHGRSGYSTPLVHEESSKGGAR